MRKSIRKVGIYCGTLLLGVSGYALLRHVATENAPEFNRTKVTVNKDKMSIQDFYSGLQMGNAGWLFIDKDGKPHNVDSLCDSRHRENALHGHYKHVKLKEKIDTVYVRYSGKEFREKTKSNFIYKVGVLDSLPNLPSMGKYSYDLLLLREFVGDNPKLQKIFDIYNDSHNCTKAHEFQHYLNNTFGMHDWNSYSIKFAECCLDEVSANIAQCVAQRENYLKHNRDLSYITGRFRYYTDSIKAGVITPTLSTITPKEQKIIAEGVFKGWMEDKFEIYRKNNQNRTISYLKDASYGAVQENWDRHNALMKKFFNINGYDFWKYVQPKEKEIFENISDEQKKVYASWCRKKFREMSHFEKLEYLRMSEGNLAYNRDISGNVFKAKLIKTFGMDK